MADSKRSRRPASRPASRGGGDGGRRLRAPGGPTAPDAPRARVAPGAPLGPRTCALDLGRARVGVAIDDELGLYAHPRGVLDGRDRPALLARLVELVREDGVGRFVVGLPLDMKGGEGDAARIMRKTAQAIADATGVEVELWDERLTTVQARRALAASEVHGARARARIDEAAAVTILQAWLDRRGPVASRPRDHHSDLDDDGGAASYVDPAPVFDGADRRATREDDDRDEDGEDGGGARHGARRR